MRSDDTWIASGAFAADCARTRSISLGLDERSDAPLVFTSCVGHHVVILVPRTPISRRE